MYNLDSLLIGFMFGGFVVFIIFLIIFVIRDSKIDNLKYKIRQYEYQIENFREHVKIVKSM